MGWRMSLRNSLEDKANEVHDSAHKALRHLEANRSEWQKKENHVYGEGVEIYETISDNGTHYAITVDTRNDVKTVAITSSDTDRTSPINSLVGTDHRAVVKIFGPNAYDYIKVDDYIDRQLLMFNAARALAGGDAAAIARIDAYQQKVLAEIREKCKIDQAVRDANSDAAAKFNDGLAIAKGIMKNALVDLAYLVHKNPDKKKITDFIHKIKAEEINIIREQGRPFVIKTGDIAGKKMVSMQFPLGDETVPSSDRSGKHGVKLSNHVRDGSGVVNDKGKIELRMVIDGHSSYPPIGESEEMTRRYIAYLAVKEKVDQLIKDKLAAGETPPIQISIATMMMLTPAIGKMFESLVRGKESEHQQLSDVQYAVRMFCAERNDQNEIERDINGQKVKATVDFSLMNLPVNVGRKMQFLLQDPLQKEVNKRGFQEFSDHMREDFKTVDRLVVTQPFCGIDISALKESDTIKNNINAIKIDIESKQAFLNVQYRNLAKFLHEKKDSPKNAALRNEYSKMKEGVLAGEAKLKKLYDNIHKMEAKYYNDNKASYNKLIDDIQKRLRVRHEDDPTPLADGDRQKLIKLLRYLQAQKIYREKAFYHRDETYQFHINYLLANHAAGSDIEAFCKSAEDRTGWLRVSLLANLAFEEKYGYPPNMADQEERKQYFELFAAKSLELSASIENTGYNSQARSLQVETSFTNPLYNMQAGNLLSKLAKGIFPKIGWLDAIPQPSPVAQDVLKSPPHVSSAPPLVVTATALSGIPPLDANASNSASSLALLPMQQVIHGEYDIEKKEKGEWKKNSALGKERLVQWDVTRTALNHSSLVVTDTKNIEKGLLTRGIFSRMLLTDFERQKRLDLAAALVEAVIAPLREAGATLFVVDATLPAQYQKLGPYIAAYCSRQGYECHVVPDKPAPVNDKQLDRVADKYKPVPPVGASSLGKLHH